MGELNLFQQICVQIFTADLAGAFIGPEKILQLGMNIATNAAIKSWLGDYGWKIVWGPRVWKAPDDYWFEGLDNCWMISMAPDVEYPDGKFDTYVVAIAGTAIFSVKDWVEEDFGVDHVIDFDAFTKTWKDGPIVEPKKGPRPTTNDPCAAWGTAWGAYQVVTNTSPVGNPGEGTTILQYLAGLNKSGANFRVVFAGHSLGGALAPFLSLAFKVNGLIPALAQNPDNILTFPAAGASPGDARLAELYKHFFPISGPGGYQQWNADLFNSLDIVPQAWSTDDTNDRCLDNIVDIYGKLGPLTHFIIKEAVDIAKNHAKVSGITYQPIEGNKFTGTRPSAHPANLAIFIAEAAKQHTKAYHDEVGVGDILSKLYGVVASTQGLRKKTAREAGLSMPVVRLAAGIGRDPPKNVSEGIQLGNLDGKLDYAGPEGPDGGSVAFPYDCILEG